MFRLLEFIRSTYVVILFVIAEVVAINHYAWSDSYARAKIFIVTNSMFGGVMGAVRGTTHLLKLPNENRELSQRIAKLEGELAVHNVKNEVDTLRPAIVFDDPTHTYIVAKVISNSINKHDNFIIVDKGIDDGVYERMAVITPSGEMVGYIAGCSSHYSAALSVLSHSFTTSGKVVGGNNFGSIGWQGRDRYSVTMSELSKYEEINKGDTIVSTGFSNIFPGDVTIGTISSFEFNEMQTAYNVEIDLAAEITAINYVLLVGNRDSGEIDELMESVDGSF